MENKDNAIEIIRVILKLNRVMDYSYAYEGIFEPETYEDHLIQMMTDHTFDSSVRLIDVLCEMTGLDKSEFEYDEFMNMCDKVFSGDYREDEILGMFEDVGKIRDVCGIDGSSEDMSRENRNGLRLIK